MARVLRTVLVALALVAGTASAQSSAVQATAEPPPAVMPETFVSFLYGEPASTAAAFVRIDSTWEPSYLPMLLDTVRLSQNVQVSAMLLQLMQRKTGQAFGYDLQAWKRWIWETRIAPHPHYAEFMSKLYRLVDPKFEAYFGTDRPARIRLDEVMWGGVLQDGIPPLRRPSMIPAAEATYLDDSNVVFGISVNGDARAYPKRILAWHEMFVDDVGGVPVAGVYCTLCGTVILYETEHEGTNHALGTSGFLFRSNKLMYDQATQSLWSTMRGEPVIGPLVGQDIRLARRSVVTTTWGEWRRRHPETKVLSLETGHDRNYDEGAAYRDYFATDELMFPVSALDGRLKNKDEVLALVFAQHPDRALAIGADYLLANPVHHDAIESVPFVVLTDPSGANRVYEAPAGWRVAEWDGNDRARDADGAEWTVSESRLEADDGRTRARLPAHRAFWFGWYAAYPRTRLVAE